MFESSVKALVSVFTLWNLATNLAGSSEESSFIQVSEEEVCISQLMKILFVVFSQASSVLGVE